MVLLSPFLHELRRLVPSARITLVCLPMTASLFEVSADIDETVEFPTSTHRILRPFVLPRRARALAKHRLRGPFDLAIVPRWDTDHHLAAAVAAFSGAPRRLGHSEQSNPRKQIFNAGFDALYTDLMLEDGIGHEVERHLAMLRVLGAEPISDQLRLTLSIADRERAAEALARVPNDKVLIALGIGAAHPKRRWPASRFIEVARELQARPHAHLVIIGGPDDVVAQERILRNLDSRALGLAGRLTLRESAAVLERCALFVGNNSAPLHLAAAAGVACVEVSCHPTGGDPLHYLAPERFGPWRVPNVVVRPVHPMPPCGDGCAATLPHCILGVSANAVIHACSALLDKGGRPSELGLTTV